MTDLDELEKKLPFGHIILWSVVVFIFIALIWAYFAKIDEVTTGTGKVIPSQKVQIIQSLEGGIVKKILVKEGERVNKGQILMYLDDVKFSSDYKANQHKIIALRVKILRLKAEMNNKPFVPSEEVKKLAPEVVNSEMALYKSRKNELANMQTRLNLLAREIKMTAPLVKSGAVSEVELLRVKQSFNEIKGKVQAFRSATLKELNEDRAELRKLQADAQALEDRLRRTAVRSPVKGIVKQVHVATIGGVIKAGSPMIEIVPLEDTLRVEVQIKPDDIGFIKIGQPAMVKVTAYDFTIYGGLEGKVEHISADTSTDDEGNSYYEVWVRTKTAYLGKGKNKLRIIPGMQASVSILTGKKSVLTYLLKPILRAKEKALRER